MEVDGTGIIYLVTFGVFSENMKLLHFCMG